MLRKVRLTRDGYLNGRYFGAGLPLYEGTLLDGSVEHFRAVTRADAVRQYVRRILERAADRMEWETYPNGQARFIELPTAIVRMIARYEGSAMPQRATSRTLGTNIHCRLIKPYMQVGRCSDGTYRAILPNSVSAF